MIYISLLPCILLFSLIFLANSFFHPQRSSKTSRIIILAADETTQSKSWTKQLLSLKQSGHLQKFASSISFAKPMSSKEFYQISRISFSSPRYFEDIIQSMDINQKSNELIRLYISSSIISVIFSSIVFPIIDMSQDLKNILSIACLAYPFLGAIVCFSFPDIMFKLIASLRNVTRKNLDGNLESERILYHEAGHILVGYLCGVAVSSYVVDEDISSHAAVDIDKDYFTATLNDQRTKPPKLGISNLILLAMAGVVAETLRYGDAKGGGQDLLVARSLLASINVTALESEDYLRWATAKALALLRLNRDALDELAKAMKDNTSIEKCYQIIENVSEIEAD